MVTSLLKSSIDETKLRVLAHNMAKIAKGPLVLFLKGEIGAGKTTFVRLLYRALGVTGPIKSPTYTLFECYTAMKFSVLHADLYRLSHPEELEYIGIDDALAEATISCIEWPEKSLDFLPNPDLELCFSLAGELTRDIKITALSLKGQQYLDALTRGE